MGTRDSGAYFRVQEALKDHAKPGALIQVDRIAAAAGSSRKTTLQALAWVVLRGGPVERVGTGTYRYLGEPAEAPTSVPSTTTLFEKVAALEGGELLLRCEVGDLYIARRFETKL